jgi:hypothetical protein
MKHTKTTTAARIYSLLGPTLKESHNFDEAIDLIDKGLAEWRNAIVSQLKDKATSWEEKMDDGDATLYSLGLRHAIDVVSNYDPTTDQKEN